MRKSLEPVMYLSESEEHCFRLRDAQRTIWDRTASGRLAAQGGVPSAISLELISLAGILPGMKVLDMACGTGDPAIEIAHTIGASGSIQGLDISPAMVAIAIEAAREAELKNSTFKVIQNETKLDVAPESFDAVTCRFGLMFMPNPLAALRAWTRSLKSGGYIAVCTHGALPSFETTMEIVEREAPNLADSLNWRQVLSLASVDALDELFADCELTDVNVTRSRRTHVRGATVSECWDAMIRRSPICDGLQALPGSVNQAIRDSCIRALSVDSRSDLGGLFGGEVLFASGRRC